MALFLVYYFLFLTFALVLSLGVFAVFNFFVAWFFNLIRSILSV